MTAFYDFNLAALIELWAAVGTVGGDVSERSQDIYFRQGQRCLPDTPRLTGDERAQFGEDAALDFYDLFLAIENFRFVLFYLRSSEPLGVHHRLLTLVVSGR